MKSFHGTFEELQTRVSATGRKGLWADIANGKQFRCDDGAILNWFPGTGRVQYQGSEVLRDKLQTDLSVDLPPFPNENITTEAFTPTADTDSSARPKVFVVHGHDTVAREQLELALHKLKLDPFVLANTGGGGLTIIEALEKEIGPRPGRTRFGIVLLTPDDMGYAKADGDGKAEPRARQNVVLEMGMLISALGRPNVAILKKGHIEIPSDAHGILYIPFNDHIREAIPRLVDRLRAAGFEFDAECISRASSYGLRGARTHIHPLYCSAP